MGQSDQHAARTAGLAVAAVAVTASVISFEHVRSLAIQAGETQLTSWLLPVSIDGAVVASVAVLLADSRAGRRPLPLTIVLLGLGLMASLAANVASAAPAAPARAVAAWPPVALALGIEVLAGLIRRSRPAAADAGWADAPATQLQPPARHMAPWPTEPTTPARDTPAALANRPPHPAPGDATPPIEPAEPKGQTEPKGIAEPAAAAEPTEPTEPARAVEPAGAAEPAEPAGAAESASSLRASRVHARDLAPDDDDAALELIRELDRASARGQVTRREIETALGCGNSRAARLARKARGT